MTHLRWLVTISIIGNVGGGPTSGGAANDSSKCIESCLPLQVHVQLISVILNSHATDFSRSCTGKAVNFCHLPLPFINFSSHLPYLLGSTSSIASSILLGLPCSPSSRRENRPKTFPVSLWYRRLRSLP